MQAILEIEEEAIIFILNQDKGLSVANNALRDKIICAICIYYLQLVDIEISQKRVKARFSALSSSLPTQ
jgi:hypothetical protein